MTNKLTNASTDIDSALMQCEKNICISGTIVGCCILFCCVVGRGEQRTMLLVNTPHNTPKTCSQQPDIYRYTNIPRNIHTYIQINTNIHKYTQIYTDIRGQLLLCCIYEPVKERQNYK